MSEISVIFLFKGKEKKYTWKKDEIMKKILSKFASDIEKEIDDLTFMCQGRKIAPEIKLEKLIKSGYQIKITVYLQEDNKTKEEIEKERIEKEERLKDIIKNQLSRKMPEKEDDKIKVVLEDMCAMGKIVKDQIIEEKKKNPEKFVSIEEATKDENKEDSENGLFCLGLLAKNLEDQGMVTAIEKEKSEKEEDQQAANTTLQFLFNGMATNKKFGLNFELGKKRNNELLTNKEEQKKFNDKLKKKLSEEYKIPEDKILVTYPQKGSYEVQVIFEDASFCEKDDFDLNKFKEKCKDNDTYKELCELKKVHKSLIMEGCKLSQNMLDNRGNRESGWGEGEKRGGHDYNPPKGWKGYGLNVYDKYDGGKNDWLDYDNNPNEWAIAYHGVGRASSNPEKIAGLIAKTGFKAGANQVYEDDDDLFHPGKKVGKGVYCSPYPSIMDEYAGTSNINGKSYKVGFMIRVKPDKIRCAKNQQDYWVLNGTTDEMRPYRILIKEE